jgi:AraC-like DNA-binding protein
MVTTQVFAMISFLITLKHDSTAAAVTRPRTRARPAVYAAAISFTAGFLIAACFASSLQAESITLRSGGSIGDILTRSQICTQGTIEPSSIEACEWTTTGWSHQSFAYRSDPVWVRFKVTNESPEDVWYIISEYAWIDHVDLFERTENSLRLIELNGDRVPVRDVSVFFKQPAFRIDLRQGESREFYLRFYGDSELFIGISMEDRITFSARGYSLRDLFLAAGALSLLVILGNILLWVRVKSDIPPYYFLFATASLAYMTLLDGSLLRQILATNLFADDHLHFGVGIFTTGTILLVWTRLIPMAQLFPILERITRYYAYFSFGMGLLIALGAVPSLIFVEILARIALLYSNLTFYPTAFIAYRRGFRPAIYPMFGLPLFSVLMFLYLMSGLLFSGNIWLKNSVWLAYLAEYSVFFISMVSRIRFEASGEMRVFEEAVRRKSRLRGIDTQDLTQAIDSLMKDEIYRDETLTLATMSERLGIRPDQLSEFINVKFGMGFRRWLNKNRVTAAQRMLIAEPGHTILRIALDTGFGTKAAFNREFKTQTGLTPTEYRAGKFADPGSLPPQ